MSTVKAAVSRVRSSLKLTSSDIKLSDRAIAAELKSVASKLIRQQLDKRKLWDSTNIFTPLRIELIPIPLVETCNYESDCLITRSKYKLPKIGDSSFFGLIIQGFYSVGHKGKFTQVTPDRYINILKLGLSGKTIYYWFFNDYIYTSSPTLEEGILPAFIEGDVSAEFNIDCEESCVKCPENPLDKDFKVPSYLENDIINLVRDEYQKTYKRSGEDTISNDLDESK